MNDILFAHSVAFWRPRDLTLGEFLSHLEGFLRGLREIDPVFSSEFYVHGKRALRVHADLGNLQEIALAHAWDAHGPKHWYSELDDRGSPTLASHSAVGWALSLATEPDGERTSRFVRISARDRRQDSHPDGRSWDQVYPNAVEVFTQDQCSPLLDPVAATRLFRFLVEYWNPLQAFTADDRFRASTASTLTQEHFGWLNYRADPGYARHLPNTVHREPLGTGLFFRIGDDRIPTSKDTAEVHTARMIQDSLQRDTAPPCVFRPYSELSWGPRDATLRDFLSRVEVFLRGLKRTNPVFSEFYVLSKGGDRALRLNDDLSDFTDVAFSRAWGVYDPEHWYTDRDERGGVTLDSRCMHAGWTLDLVTEPEPGRTSHFVHISLREGRQSQEAKVNGIRIAVEHKDSPLLESGASERLFTYLVKFWSPEEGCVTEARFRDATKGKLTHEQLGWLNYRADPDFARYLPDTVRREPLGTGLLFRIGDGRVLTEEDTAEVHTGRAIQTAIQNNAPQPPAQ